MATHLTVEQRLDWLTVRIAELELWVAREWVGLTDWTFDGAPLAVGAPWPERGGVHRLAHARVTPPWPDARLELDDRGRAVRGPGPPLRRTRRARLRRRDPQRRPLRPPRARVRARPQPAPLADLARPAGRRGRAGARVRAPPPRHRRRAACRGRGSQPPAAGPSERGAAGGRPLGVTGRAALGALKPLEDGEGLALRVYEPFGDRGRVTVTPPPGWALDTELDLLERPLGAPRTELDAFAVRTWSLRPTSSPPSG